MAYTTKAAEELIDTLQIAASKYEERSRKADQDNSPENAHDRGLWAGYRDCYKQVVDLLKASLEDVEKEARLIPEVEEDAAEWLRKQMSVVNDYDRDMAGDFRDWPAA